MHLGEPLQYPSHYPSTDRWKRFFIGVRWLGPDLSFFKALRSAQASRTSSTMNVWGGGERQALASDLGIAFSRYCRWPTPYFLPGDVVSVVVGGPKFAAVDNTDIEDAIGAVEEIADVKMGPAFWKAAGSHTVSELVDQLLAVAGPNNSFKPTSLC